MPIILNHDYVVLDGHHRLRACKELGLKASHNINDFTGKPLEEAEIRSKRAPAPKTPRRIPAG